MKRFLKSVLAGLTALSLIACYVPALVLADENGTDEAVEEISADETTAPDDVDDSEADEEYTFYAF